MQNLHVSIIGAGLGGLCLAQGLARAGIDFDVYERDARTDSRVQGYRLRIDATGQAALAHCLPPDLYALFQQSCSTHDRPGAMLDARLRPLPQRASATWRLDDADTAPDRSAHRQTLREILLAGLDGRVHFGHGCAGMDAGGPRLEGIRARPGTLVVAADGVHSALRRQHLPHAVPADTGTVTIFGMAPAGSLAPDGLPPDLRDGAGVVFGAGYALVLDAMRLAALPPLARRLAPGCTLTAVPGYQYWAIIGERRAVLGADDADAATHANRQDDTMTGARWQQAAQRLLAPVHPALAAMVAASDPQDVYKRQVLGQVHAIVGAPALFAEHQDAIARQRAALDQLLDAVMADHAIADDDQGLHGSRGGRCAHGSIQAGPFGFQKTNGARDCWVRAPLPAKLALSGRTRARYGNQSNKRAIAATPERRPATSCAAHPNGSATHQSGAIAHHRARRAPSGSPPCRRHSTGMELASTGHRPGHAGNQGNGALPARPLAAQAGRFLFWSRA